jgi:hypothetical protein
MACDSITCRVGFEPTFSSVARNEWYCYRTLPVSIPAEKYIGCLLATLNAGVIPALIRFSLNDRGFRSDVNDCSVLDSSVNVCDIR